MRLHPSLTILLASIPFLQYQITSALPPRAPSLPLPVSLTLNPTNNNHTNPLHFARTTWNITPTLHLALVLTDWQPSPNSIVSVLRAALKTIGKRPRLGLLDHKFTQRSPNKYNTLYFEIVPQPGEPKRLTWDDVGYVVGEDGLEAFYEKYFEKVRWWNTVYFTVVETGKGGRGLLGQGAVRRWWQLGGLPPHGMRVRDDEVGTRIGVIEG